jgi:hypothetical protein
MDGQIQKSEFLGSGGLLSFIRKSFLKDKVNWYLEL